MGDYTFSRFKDELKFELGERTDIESHTDLSNLYGKWINTAYKRFTNSNRAWGLGRNFYFPELEISTTSNTSDGDAYISVPSDCLIIREVFDNTNTVRLGRVSHSDYIKYTDRDDTDSEEEPTEWVRRGSYIYLHPTPDDTYEMEVYFRKRVTSLSNDTDTTAIGEEWDELILKMAVILGLMKLKRYEEAKFEKQEWMTMFTDIIGIYDQEEKATDNLIKPDSTYFDFSF